MTACADQVGGPGAQVRHPEVDPSGEPASVVVDVLLGQEVAVDDGAWKVSGRGLHAVVLGDDQAGGHRQWLVCGETPAGVVQPLSDLLDTVDVAFSGHQKEFSGH